jgi:uncharacterized protein DUF3473
MPHAPRWPHRRNLDGTAGIAEFPLPTTRCGPFNLPATGGAYLRLLPYRFQSESLRRMLGESRPFVLTVHPWELDPDQPRMRVGLRTRWTHYHGLAHTAERLSGLLSLCAYRPLAAVLEELGLLTLPQ